MKNLFLCLSLLFILFSCTTAEDIRRQEQVASLSNQISQSQKLAGDFAFRVEALEEKVASLRGQVEESKYEQQKSTNEIGNQLSEELNTTKARLEALEKKIDDLAKQVEEQFEFIKSATSALKSMKGKKKSESSRDSKSSEYDQAVQLYSKYHYTKARPMLLSLLNNKSLNYNKKATVLHHLGMIEFRKKKYADSLIYLSKVYSNYPKSKFAAHSLLHIGKIFLKQNEKEQAKSAFSEVIKKYSHSRYKSEAQKLLGDL